MSFFLHSIHFILVRYPRDHTFNVSTLEGEPPPRHLYNILIFKAFILPLKLSNQPLLAFQSWISNWIHQIFEIYIHDVEHHPRLSSSCNLGTSGLESHLGSGGCVQSFQVATNVHITVYKKMNISKVKMKRPREVSILHRRFHGWASRCSMFPGTQFQGCRGNGVYILTEGDISTSIGRFTTVQRRTWIVSRNEYHPFIHLETVEMAAARHPLPSQRQNL